MKISSTLAYFLSLGLLLVQAPKITRELPQPDFKVVNRYQVEAYHQFIVERLGEEDPISRLREVRREAKRRAQELLLIGQRLYGLPKIPLNQMSWDIISTTGGKAVWPRRLIRMNEILYLNNYQTYMGEIIPHEVAHLVHHQMYGDGNKLHSEPFLRIMEDLVGFSTSGHHMDVTPVCDFLREMYKAEARTNPCSTCVVSVYIMSCPVITIAVADYQK